MENDNPPSETISSPEKNLEEQPLKDEVKNQDIKVEPKD